MRKIFILFVMFYSFDILCQQDFNTKSHTSIDLSYFNYFSRHIFSSELQLRHKKQYVFGGVSLGEHHQFLNGNNWQYAFKVGYGLYPYKNLKKLKVHHRLNYAFEADTQDKDWRLHYFVVGNGVEYWISNKFTLGLNVNMQWGYGNVVGAQFVFQPLFTGKYIFKERQLL
jgi:hypothetical protein